MAIKPPNSIEFAGDYNLDHVFLHNHRGDIVDIKKMMSELNIFESIFKNALTGSLVILDAQNLISKLEINGTERISFKLSTPGAIDSRSTVDASEETGHPFHVYKITDRKQVLSGTMMYTIHFASREFMRNLRTKVSQTYRGNIAYQVMKIMMDKDYLDTKKEISYEPTGNINDIVIPNMRPFDAINMIAKKTIPELSGGVGYYFYETTKGMYFRSWENMVTVKGSYNRRPKQEFYYMPMNVDDPTIKDKINHDYKSVESYRFVNNFHDVAANTLMGTYGHKVITHNLFDKSYKETTYNYHNQFSDTKHTDFSDKNARHGNEKYAIPHSKIDQDGKNVSDYGEARVSLQSTTQFLHDKESGARYGLDVAQEGRKLSEGISQRAQVAHGTVLKLVVKGQSYIEPGDVINFKLRSVASDNPDGKEDPNYSGKYVVTKIRHQVNDTKYTMALECAKDSVKTGFSSSYKVIPANKNYFGIRNIYTAEEPYGSS